MATSTPDRFLVHRRARTHPPPLAAGELLVAAPPAVAWSAPPAAAWLQYLVPLLGGAGSLAFLFAVPGPRHPLLVAAVAGTAVASLALGVGLRLAERRNARRARRRERSRYLAHLAQVAAAADHLAAAQLAAADHLHPDPARLWALACQAERLWERRPDDDDFLTVRVGRGPVPLHAPVRLDAAGGPLVERDAGLLAAAEALVRRAGRLPQAPVTVPLAGTGQKEDVMALPKVGTCYCGCGRDTGGCWVAGHDHSALVMLAQLQWQASDAAQIVVNAGYGPGRKNLLDTWQAGQDRL
jgi:S-DNA-T family DNA segregation ATPase FtsK/SpoIIIE